MNLRGCFHSSLAIFAATALTLSTAAFTPAYAAGDSDPVPKVKKKVVKKTTSQTKKKIVKKKKKVVKLSPYQLALADIKKWRYEKAATRLQTVVAKDADNADAWNWLGYSLRKQQKYDESYEAYQTALKLDANHVGAHEYLGELYLQTDRAQEAQAQYAKLRELCPSGCQQLNDLEKAITEVTLEDLDEDGTKAVQSALKDKGFYKSAIDGDFGKGSRRALRAFQDANGIQTAGLTDETKAALGL